MKHFGFYVTPGKVDRAGNSTDTVTVFYIQDNVPIFIARDSRGYRTPGQAAVELAIRGGRLGKGHEGKSTARLFNDGIASFHEL